jgi:ADP-heptose:LPS heptosyltransferase
VFTTPAIQALRERYPDAWLAYLVEPAAAPVVERNPCLNEVIVAPRRRGFRGTLHDLALGRRIRRQRFDIAIDFHGGPRASLLTWLSGAPIRIGYDIPGRGWMYTRQVTRPRVLRPRHSVENQWDLLEPLGIPPPDRVAHPVTMSVAPEVADQIGRRLSEAGCESGDRLVVMHVSAGNPFRRWPLTSFADVVTALTAAYDDVRILVTSGPSELAAAGLVVREAQARMTDRTSRHVIAAGDLSLVQLRALVERAALYIGGDSGPMHVAATTRVPIVSLYGPTLPERSEPWRPGPERAVALQISGLPCRPCDQRTCIPGDFRCLGRIGPDPVIEAARRFLDESG